MTSLGRYNGVRWHFTEMPQHAAKSLPTFELTGGTTYFLTRRDDPIAQPLVIAFSVVMRQELTHGVS